MAANNTISVSFVLKDGANGLKVLTANADDLRKVMSATVTAAEKINKQFINFAAFSKSLNAVSDTISSLKSVMGELSSAYAVQEMAETKLMTIMRQRMGATDEEIQSIKDLASAQQQMGVIGDEVQLSGAQQIATFLKEKTSLETLLPAMNNLLAQQKGLKATTGDAVTVGNLMGKAMMGQVDALKRVGITFTEAEANVMKYGTEQERAAMLAQIITNNVGNMNAALAQTDSGKLQQTNNWLGDLKEKLGALATGFMPFVSIAASTTTATLGIFKLYNGIGVLYAWLKNIIAGTGKFVMALKKAYAALSLLGLNGKSTAAAVRIFNAALTSGAYLATAFKIALRGLLIASGIGAVIWGVTAIVEYFANKTDEATESVEKFDDATNDFTQAASQAKVQIDNDIKSLGELIKSHGDTTDAIQHLNETYGDTFGVFETAEEWYDTLIKKSGLYAKQIGYEAQAKALAAKVAEAALKKEMANDRIKELKEAGKDKVKVFGIGGSSITGYTQTTSKTVDSDEYKQALKDKAEAEAEEAKYQKQLDKTAELAKNNNDELKKGLGDVNSELKVSEMSLSQVNKAIEENEKALRDTTDDDKIKKLRAYNAQLQARKKLMEGKTGLGNQTGVAKEQLVSDPKTKDELRNNIDILSKKRTGENTPEQQQLTKDIALYKERLEAIEAADKAAARPTELNTLEDIDAEISYQRDLRQKSAAENIAAIDEEIYRLEDLRRQKELSGFVPTPVSEIKTYEELNRHLAYYNTLREKGNAEQRVAAQQSLNELNAVKKKWDEALAELEKPADISALNSIDELDKAISYYQQKQKVASENEIQNIQKTIDAHNRKRDALQRGVELQSMSDEADEINNLTGRDYKVKIRGMGFDELTAKINDLKRMLNDTENPVTESQRKDIESLIATYEKWRKEGIDAFGTFRTGWDGVKGIGSGVEGITSALEGNGNAWQKLTGIVDGFIQIYEGISAVVRLINMLTEATKLQTLATEEKTAATITDTTATVADTTASVTNTAVTIADTTASATNTAAKSGEAIANATASGAKLPFPMNLIAIAAGVAAVISALAMIGGFANGGIVGGTSKSGDKLLARVNSGEMILNSSQQSRLFKMLNTPVVAQRVLVPAPYKPEISFDKLHSMLKPSESIGGNVTFKIEGRTLVGVLARENNLNRRS